MTDFNRGNFTQLWIKLTSDEPLGILDTDYLEDYYGNDGQITLHHVLSTTDYQINMLPVPGDTPSVPNDVFQGVYSPLSNLVDGLYELRFRCRDPYGNYTISNSVQSPFGDERIINLTLNLTTVLSIMFVTLGPVVVRLGRELPFPRDLSVDAVRSSVAVNADRGFEV